MENRARLSNTEIIARAETVHRELGQVFRSGGAILGNGQYIQTFSPDIDLSKLDEDVRDDLEELKGCRVSLADIRDILGLPEPVSSKEKPPYIPDVGALGASVYLFLPSADQNLTYVKTKRGYVLSYNIEDEFRSKTIGTQTSGLTRAIALRISGKAIGTPSGPYIRVANGVLQAFCKRERISPLV